MSIRYLEGDLFYHLEQEKGQIVLPHIVNDKNAWGAGFVLPLARKFPQAKESYHGWANGIMGGPFILGNVFAYDVEPNITVVHMLAQTLGGIRPLFYNHLARCMDDVAAIVKKIKNAKIISPMFGSGLAGGNWLFIEELIRDCWIKQGIDVTICYLKEQAPSNWQPPSV